MNMMNVTEEYFVRSVFRKEFCDRLCYELSSTKKRDRFFNKLAHNCEDYINRSVIKRRSDMPMTGSEILAFLRDEKEIFVIAYRSDLDGRSTDADTAVSELVGNGSPFIVVAPGRRRAYLETEYDFSVHTSYLLEY